jgi:hypothetical protein
MQIIVVRASCPRRGCKLNAEQLNAKMCFIYFSILSILQTGQQNKVPYFQLTHPTRFFGSEDFSLAISQYGSVKVYWRRKLVFQTR